MTPSTPSPVWEQVASTLSKYDEADIRKWQQARLESMLREPKIWTSTERSFAAQINAVLLLLDAARAADASQIEEKDAEIAKLDVLLSQASQASMLNRRAYLEEHDKVAALSAQVEQLTREYERRGAQIRELKDIIDRQ